MIKQIFKKSYIEGTIQSKSLKALIDTGATYTIVSPELCNSLGFIPSKEYGIIEITACREIIKVPKVIIPLLELDGSIIENVEAYISDTGFDVLIGIDTIGKLGFLHKTGKLKVEY